MAVMKFHVPKGGPEGGVAGYISGFPLFFAASGGRMLM